MFRLSVLTLVTSSFVSAQRPAELDATQLAQQLQQHLAGARGFSARLSFSGKYFKGRTLKPENWLTDVAWIKDVYSKQTATYATWDGGSFWESNFLGSHVVVLRQAGQTETIHCDQEVSIRGHELTWQIDTLPEAYYLDLPTSSFAPMLPDLVIDEVTSRGSENIYAFTVPNFQKTDLSLRIKAAQDRRGFRIEELTLWLRSGDAFRRVESWTFSEFFQVGKERFPRVHTKQMFNAEDLPRTIRTCSLEDVKPRREPMTLRYPPGTVLIDRTTAIERKSIVGDITDAYVRAYLGKLAAWKRDRAGATLFRTAGLADRLGEKGASTASLGGGRDNLCGLYSARLAAILAGAPTEPDTAAYLDKPEGLSMLDLQRYAEESGLHTRAGRMSLHELLSFGKPAVIRVRLGKDLPVSHFVTVAGRVGDNPVILDMPADGFVASLDWVERHWDGSAVVFSDEEITSFAWGFWSALGGILALLVGILGFTVRNRRGRHVVAA